jgi:hypothetical protein
MNDLKVFLERWDEFILHSRSLLNRRITRMQNINSLYDCCILTSWILQLIPSQKQDALFIFFILLLFRFLTEDRMLQISRFLKDIQLCCKEGFTLLLQSYSNYCREHILSLPVISSCFDLIPDSSVILKLHVVCIHYIDNTIDYFF